MGGKGGKSSGSTSSTTTTVPWSGQQPYYKQIFAEAQKQYNKGPTTYVKRQLYDFTEPQTWAMNETIRRAQNPDASIGQMKSMLGNLITQTPGSNPYAQAAIQAAIRPVTENFYNSYLPTLRSTANAAGRYGGGLNQLLEADAVSKLNRDIGDISATMSKELYENDLNRAMVAVPLMQSVNTDEWNNLQRAFNIGLLQQQFGQQLLDEETAAKQYAQEEPWQRLARYQAAIGGNLGGTTTAQTPYYRPSTASSILGAGLTGMGAGGLATFLGASNPVGWAVGLGAGLLDLLS